MRPPLRALVLCALIPAGCTLLVDRSPVQCAIDGDCKRFNMASVCMSSLCVLPAPPDSGSDGGADAGADGGVDAGPVLGPPGCFRGTPDADIDFYNACTSASFLVFDNCGRAGLCDGGEPAIVKPDAGAAAMTMPVDGGPPVSCYDATARPNVIFMNGSTNFTPFIRVMVPIVLQSGYVIVWQPTSSCTGADTIFNTDMNRRVMRNPTNTGQSPASFYTMANLPNGTPCSLGNSPQSPGPNIEVPDIGQSDIYATSCPVTSAASPFNTYEPGQGAFMPVRHYLGPVQSMMFVTPPNSTQRVISAEAARLILGLGGAGGGVAPWTDSAFVWIRSPTTGTAGIISRGVGVPATDFWGVDQRTAPNMVSQIKSVSINDSERTLGLLSIDFADREKDNLHMMYFQPRGGLAGFLPDLHPYTRDKENVRDGHYPLWGPIHLYARANAGGSITLGAAAFVTQFSVPRPEQALLDATIETGNVPSCAMKVTRDTEMGPLRHYEPPFQCHCYYQTKLNAGVGCKACTGPAECPVEKPFCNLGFCEKSG